MVSLFNRPEYYNNPYKGEEYTGTNFLGNPNFPQYSSLKAGMNYYSGLPNYKGGGYNQNTASMYSAIPSNRQPGMGVANRGLMSSNRQPGIGIANNRPVATATNTPPNLQNNLLNYLVSPQGKGMAQGLLEASGYSRTPVSFGQALAMGMRRSNEAQARADAQKLKQDQFQFQKDQAKINERLVESQIYKNLNPVQALSSTAKQMKEAFPNLVPGTPEYQDKFMELLKSTASTMTITNEAQGKGAETMAELDARDVSDTRKLVNDNFELVSRLGIMESLVDDPDFETGPLTASSLPIRKFLAEQGFLTKDAKEKVSKQQLFEAYANYLVPRMRVVGSGATSDFEAELFASATAGLGKDELSNRILVKSFKLMQDHMKFAAQEKENYFYRKLEDGSTAYNLQGFNQHMEEKIKNKPIFKKYANDNEFAKAVNDGTLKKNDLFFDLEDGQFRIVDDAMIKGAKEL